MLFYRSLDCGFLVFIALASKLENRYLGAARVIMVLGCTALVASCKYDGICTEITATAKNSPFLSVLSYRDCRHCTISAVLDNCAAIPDFENPGTSLSRRNLCESQKPLHQNCTCHRGMIV